MTAASSPAHGTHRLAILGAKAPHLLAAFMIRAPTQGSYLGQPPAICW